MRFHPWFGSLAIFVFGAGLAGCSVAPPFSSHRLTDGSYELACQIPLAECLDHVDEICRGSPYDVVSAHDRRKLIGIPVGTSQRESRWSDAVVSCTKNKALFGGGSEAPGPGTAKASLCVPGSTQVCVGPAACSGGQACLADGSGFGPCVCGPASAPKDGGVTDGDAR